MRTIGFMTAAGLASAAAGQSWLLEVEHPVLHPGQLTTVITASIDPGPGSDYVAGANFHVHASEPGWSDPVAIPATRSPRVPGQFPGSIAGSTVFGISVGQLTPILGFTPEPGRIEVWRATFTITDPVPFRDFEFTTETTRFEVYIDPSGSWPREARTPVEARAVIRYIPAPGAAAVLAAGAVAAAPRRRRPAAERAGA